MPADPRLARARVLGDRTRTLLWDELSDAGTALGVGELASAVGVGEATVRKHLDRLVEAGLVERVAEPRTGPGRPPWRYRAAATAAPGTADPYEKLTSWLLAMRRDRTTPLATGRAVGLATALLPGETAAAAIVRTMAADGFAPAGDVDPARPGGTVITFHRCPYASAVHQDRAAVCALHQGFADGVARAAGDAEVVALDVHDPVLAGCRLYLAPVVDHA